MCPSPCPVCAGEGACSGLLGTPRGWESPLSARSSSPQEVVGVRQGGLWGRKRQPGCGGRGDREVGVGVSRAPQGGLSLCGAVVTGPGHWDRTGPAGGSAACVCWWGLEC